MGGTLLEADLVRAALGPLFLISLLVILNLVAAVLIPKGGFWFVLIPAYMIVRDASKANAARQAGQRVYRTATKSAA